MSVLIVEDNTISLRMLEVMLQSNGLETVTAKTGKQALEKLAGRTDVQLILSDLMMPEMDGVQLLEVLSKHPAWREIPVIVLTSLSDSDTVRRVASLGCRNYIVKPVKEESLLPKVRQLLREREQEKDQERGAEPVLRSKFRVMEEFGLDILRYEELFDAFHFQLRDLLEHWDGSDLCGPTDPRMAAILEIRESAVFLAEGRLPGLLDGLKETGECDAQVLRESLNATLQAMDHAVSTRDKIREKMNQGLPDQATPDGN